MTGQIILGTFRVLGHLVVVVTDGNTVDWWVPNADEDYLEQWFGPEELKRMLDEESEPPNPEPGTENPQQ